MSRSQTHNAEHRNSAAIPSRALRSVLERLFLRRRQGRPSPAGADSAPMAAAPLRDRRARSRELTTGRRTSHGIGCREAHRSLPGRSKASCPRTATSSRRSLEIPEAFALARKLRQPRSAPAIHSSLRRYNRRASPSHQRGAETSLPRGSPTWRLRFASTPARPVLPLGSATSDVDHADQLRLRPTASQSNPGVWDEASGPWAFP